MKQISIKNEKAVSLLEQVVQETHESKTDAVTHALELYLKSLSANKRADAAIAFVRDKLHPQLKPGQLGRAPSKAEQEELLGME